MSSPQASIVPPERPRSERQQRIFWALFGACIVANLVPLLAVKWLPTQDLGGHIELMDVMARYNDTDTCYAHVFDRPTGPRPNTLSLWLGALLGPLLGAPLLGKLLFGFYVVGLPLSIVAVARAFGRSPWLAFFAFPLTWNALAIHGLINYLVALPLLFWAIALAKAFVEQGTRGLGIRLALTLLLLWFAHVIGFLIALGMCLFVMVLYLPSRPALPRLGVLLPAIPMLGWWAWRMFVSLEATEEGRTFGLGESGLGPVYSSLDTLIHGLHVWGLQVLQGGEDETMLALLIVVWLVLMALGQRLPRSEPAPTGVLENLREYGLELMTLISFVAYLELPSELNEVEIITERVVIQMMLLGALWPRIDFDGVRRYLLVPLVGSGLLYGWLIASLFGAVQSHLFTPLEPHIANLEDRSRLFIDYRSGGAGVVHGRSAWHVPKAMHALHNGCITHESFASRPYTPVQFKPGQTPRVPDLKTGEFLSDYDYMLVLTYEPPNDDLVNPRLELIQQEGPWFLFEVIPDHPPED